jgi:hypothetical protein
VNRIPIQGAMNSEAACFKIVRCLGTREVTKVIIGDIRWGEGCQQMFAVKCPIKARNGIVHEYHKLLTTFY